MSIKAMAGVQGNAVDYHVFEVDYDMPKFSMYHWIDKPPATMPKGYCQFSLKSPSGGAGFRPFNLFKWVHF